MSFGALSAAAVEAPTRPRPLAASTRIPARAVSAPTIASYVDRSFPTSLLHGTMANAYPQALGIARANPGRQVIALCGDGGLSMLLKDNLLR